MKQQTVVAYTTTTPRKPIPWKLTMPVIREINAKRLALLDEALARGEEAAAK